MRRTTSDAIGSRAHKPIARVITVLGGLLLAGAFDRASAQSFGLDDNPAAPLVGGVGPIPGFGAEDPFGLVGPALAPSPSLAALGARGDGAWLSPGPVLQHPGPNGFYIGAFSTHHVDTGAIVALDFSVDRITRGVAGTAVAGEWMAGQAHGDIYTGSTTYVSPGVFAGTLGGGPFAGVLPALAGGAFGNTLTTDESIFGLVTSGGIVPPGVVVPPPPATPGRHDNVDSYDNALFDADGDNLFDVDAYFTLYPDEALAVGLSPADIIAVAAGDAGALAVPYAPMPSMGLVPQDSIDALVMYDNNRKPIPTAVPGAPGAIEPVTDYALFSLAPGSISLRVFGLDAADVFFTDFTGAFAVYAPSASLGLQTVPPGNPFAGDSVDALDALPAPGFTIQDGGCQFTLANITGQRLGVSGGVADLFAGARDHAFQNWFWYRATGDSREYALSRLIYSSSSNNRARLVYREPIADGQILDALLFDLEYTVSDVSSTGSVFPALSERCEVVIAIKVRNLTVNRVDVLLFSYNDMDLNATLLGDSALISGVDNQVQFVDDPLPNRARGVYKVSSTDHVAWEIDAQPVTLIRLADSFVDNLLSSVSPFGPGDYAGAQEWKFTLGPAGSTTTPPFDEWVGSVVLEVRAKLPGPRARLASPPPVSPVPKRFPLVPTSGPTRTTTFPTPIWDAARATARDPR